MAKLRGDFFIEGTIDGLTFYKMEGTYYVRMKSSLSRERFWKDRAFTGSRKSCCRFAEGNQLASQVYQMIDKEKKMYSLFCFLKRRAILLLKEGKSSEETLRLLMESLTLPGCVGKRKTKVNTVDAKVKLNHGDRVARLKPVAITYERIIRVPEISAEPATAGCYEQAYSHYG